jgi:hypothetical protein
VEVLVQSNLCLPKDLQLLVSVLHILQPAFFTFSIAKKQQLNEQSNCQQGGQGE